MSAYANGINSVLGPDGTEVSGDGRNVECNPPEDTNVNYFTFNSEKYVLDRLNRNPMTWVEEGQGGCSASARYCHCLSSSSIAPPGSPPNP